MSLQSGTKSPLDRKPQITLTELHQKIDAGVKIAIAKAIEKSFVCNRVNIITVGLEVPHAHVHLIPTNSLADMNLANKKLKFSKEEFTEIQQRIISKLE